MGALSIDTSDNLDVVFARASAGTYPSVGITGQLSTDPHNTWQPIVIIQNGAGPDSSDNGRYGDYFGASVDSSAGNKVWVAGQFGTSDTHWGTWIEQMGVS